MMVQHKQRRFEIAWPLAVGQGSESVVSGHTESVTPSGLRFSSRTRFSRSDLVELMVWPGSRKGIPCLARITHERREQTGAYTYDVRFEHFFGDDRRVYGLSLLAMRVRAPEAADCATAVRASESAANAAVSNPLPHGKGIDSYTLLARVLAASAAQAHTVAIVRKHERQAARV